VAYKTGDITINSLSKRLEKKESEQKKGEKEAFNEMRNLRHENKR
jgi:hypothetical protein